MSKKMNYVVKEVFKNEDIDERMKELENLLLKVILRAEFKD